MPESRADVIVGNAGESGCRTGTPSNASSSKKRRIPILTWRTLKSGFKVGSYHRSRVMT
jgi:hypothetical protein